ncbi:hypothetical protein BH10CYA1_BH10CYA1_54860 [soil metagenome]
MKPKTHEIPRRLSDDKQSNKNNSGEKLSRKEYEAELDKLQIELCYLQQWVKETGERVVIVFEGRDAAGKGDQILDGSEQRRAKASVRSQNRRSDQAVEAKQHGFAFQRTLV